MQKSLRSAKYRLILDWLVSAREKAGLTQQQVADRLNRPQSFVAKYEGGERRLDLVEFVEIAEVLQADPSEAIKLIS